MHAAGMTYKEIAKELGVTESLVVSVGSAHGIARQGWAATRKQIADLVAEGLSDVEIAEKMNLDRRTVGTRRASMVSLNSRVKKKKRDERVAEMRKGFKN